MIHSVNDLKWDEITLSGPVNLNTLASFVSSISPQSEGDFAHPPIHLRLLKSNNGQEYYLLVVMHHALYDGASIPKIFSLVEHIYHDGEAQGSVQFHELLGYFLLQEYYGTEYWVRILKGIRPTVIPRISNAPRSAHIATLDINLTQERFAQACRSLNVNPQCFGMAAWAKVLAKLTNRRDVIFGHIISGRNVPNAEEVVGPVLVSACLPKLDS